MFESDSTTIWLATHGLDPGGRPNMKGKQALLSWNVADQLVTIALVDDNESPLETVASIPLQAVTKIVFSTTNCIIKINEAFYIMEARDTASTSVKSTAAYLSAPVIAAATSEANRRLQLFARYVRSVIPERVRGGAISVKARIIAGLILSSLAIIGIIIYTIVTT